MGDLGLTVPEVEVVASDEPKVTVWMTEQCTYEMQIPLSEFAEMVLEEPEGATLAQLQELIDEHSSEDYGIEDCEGLLDKTLEHFTAVTDRSWEITLPEED